jgi:hypothetical protein
LLDQLRALGYNIEREEDIGPDGHRPERKSHGEVVLKKQFEDAVAAASLPSPECKGAETAAQWTKIHLNVDLTKDRALPFRKVAKFWGRAKFLNAEAAGFRRAEPFGMGCRKWQRLLKALI